MKERIKMQGMIPYDWTKVPTLESKVKKEPRPLVCCQCNRVYKETGGHDGYVCVWCKESNVFWDRGHRYLKESEELKERNIELEVSGYYDRRKVFHKDWRRKGFGNPRRRRRIVEVWDEVAMNG